DVLPDAQRGKLIWCETGPLCGARHGAGADLRRGEAVWVMQRDVPRALPTLRKAADEDALAVDVEALLDSGDRFEHVHLAGPVPAGAIDAAETIQLDLSLIGHGRIARPARREKSVDELSLCGVVLASVQPDVETRWLRGIVILRQCDAVW